MKTLREAKKEWIEVVKGEGGNCPCCERWGKIYSRAINNNMIKSLIWLNSMNTEWVDVPNKAPKWLLRSNQLPTLRWWGLVERATKTDMTKNHSGNWKITEKGTAFLHFGLSVPKLAFTYNGEVVGFSDETVVATDCMKDGFDYAQVMNTDYVGAEA